MSNLEFFFPKIGKLVKFTPGKKNKKKFLNFPKFFFRRDMIKICNLDEEAFE
jgi:hypothetical protein